MDWTPEMKAAAMKDAALVCKQHERIANLESLLHDCDAMLEKTWPHFGGEDAAAIAELQQRIVDAISD